MATPDTHPKPTAATPKETKHDKALEDTFPASDPVPLKQPKREPASTGDASGKLTPKVAISEEAMPAEKPM